MARTVWRSDSISVGFYEGLSTRGTLERSLNGFWFRPCDGTPRGLVITSLTNSAAGWNQRPLLTERSCPYRAS
jgi:hypothetical protein